MAWNKRKWDVTDYPVYVSWSSLNKPSMQQEALVPLQQRHLFFYRSGELCPFSQVYQTNILLATDTDIHDWLSAHTNYICIMHDSCKVAYSCGPVNVSVYSYLSKQIPNFQLLLKNSFQGLFVAYP